MNQKMGKLPKSAMFSEFDSGLDALPPAGGKGKQKRWELARDGGRGTREWVCYAIVQAVMSFNLSSEKFYFCRDVYICVMLGCVA